MDTNIALNKLPLGHSAYISSLDIEGSMRRRLLDLGFATGNLITPMLISPLGDPTAYSVMGSVVALRSDLAARINTSLQKPLPKSEAQNL